jgi:putative SOS response-associated peptidase YedK
MLALSARQESIMCGRAKLPDDVSEIKLDLKIDFDQIGDYRPRWNAAPTSKLPVVVFDAGSRILTLMRWGLIPSWAKDLKIGYSTFNARAETLTTRAAFRDTWRTGRRCLVLADGYYEWRDADKQPFAVALANRGPMTLAGLWDAWRSPAGETIKSFAIITTKANALLAPLHDRMPVVIAPETLCRRAKSTPFCGLIRTRPWRSGPSTAGSAMSVMTAPIYSHRLVSRHSATHKLWNRVGQARRRT